MGGAPAPPAPRGPPHPARLVDRTDAGERRGRHAPGRAQPPGRSTPSRSRSPPTPTTTASSPSRCSLGREGREVVVVTKDLPLRLKAGVVGLEADEYRNELATDSGWTGFVELDVWRRDHRRALRAQGRRPRRGPRAAVPCRVSRCTPDRSPRSRACIPTSACTSCAPTRPCSTCAAAPPSSTSRSTSCSTTQVGIVSLGGSAGHRQERAGARGRARSRARAAHPQAGRRVPPDLRGRRPGPRLPARAPRPRRCRRGARRSPTRSSRWSGREVIDEVDRPRPARGAAAHPHPGSQPHRQLRGDRRGAEPRAVGAAHRVEPARARAAGWCSPTTSRSATTCGSAATTASSSVIETLQGHPLFAPRHPDAIGAVSHRRPGHPGARRLTAPIGRERERRCQLDWLGRLVSVTVAVLDVPSRV